MAFLNEKHKNQLIGGLIAVTLTALGLFVKSLFDKKPEPPKQQTTTLSVLSSDSSSPVINLDNSKQENKNAGDVSNEKIGRDKVVNNFTTKATGKQQAPVEVKDNSGIVNIGGESNTYNQTIGKTQRKVSSENIEWMKANLPRDYSIKVDCQFGDAESEIYANEIVSSLKQVGFKAEFNGWSQWSNSRFGKIDFIKTDSLKIIQVNVYANKLQLP
jgi:hypothetical protein